jgi:plastocyanin domain-containing protein
MIAFFVNLCGGLIIVFIIWWFIIKKPKAFQAKDNAIHIKVHDGIYDPSVIKVQKGKSIRLSFTRYDESPCAEYVIFDKLNISSKLPMKKPHVIEITFQNAGEYTFTCQMGMYRGKVIVN